MKRRVTPHSEIPELSEAAIDAFLAGRDPAEAFGDPALFSELRKRIAERALGAELDFHLKTSDDGNTRNGHNRKTVYTESSKMDIAVPRDRSGSFKPQLVQPWCRRLKGFDNLVFSLFASGMSMRDIRDQLAATYDVSVSAELISKITDEIHEEIHEWQQRPLEQVYAIVYLDAIFVKIREDGAVSDDN